MGPRGYLHSVRTLLTNCTAREQGYKLIRLRSIEFQHIQASSDDSSPPILSANPAINHVRVRAKLPSRFSRPFRFCVSKPLPQACPCSGMHRIEDCRGESWGVALLTPFPLFPACTYSPQVLATLYLMVS